MLQASSARFACNKHISAMIWNWLRWSLPLWIRKGFKPTKLGQAMVIKTGPSWSDSLIGALLTLRSQRWSFLTIHPSANNHVRDAYPCSARKIQQKLSSGLPCSDWPLYGQGRSRFRQLACSPLISLYARTSSTMVSMRQLFFSQWDSFIPTSTGCPFNGKNLPSCNIASLSLYRISCNTLRNTIFPR